MQVREYLSVRRAYSLVRQSHPAEVRLTFEEFCILCHLHFADRAMRTSEIADYQQVLRPTMTHRTNHLDQLGLIERFPGLEDRRNVCCEISSAGRERIAEIAHDCTRKITTGMPLSRATGDRLIKYCDAMGRFYCTAGDLVLLALAQDPDTPATISELVDTLGLLQPTISMAISQLSEEGLVLRNAENPTSTRSGRVGLTEEGRAISNSLLEEVEKLVAHRMPNVSSMLEPLGMRQPV